MVREEFPEIAGQEIRQKKRQRSKELTHRRSSEYTIEFS